MSTSKICFIGGGNMTRSLIGGLVADGTDPKRIHVSEPNNDRRQALHQQFGVNVHESSGAALEDCQAVVLAVKPQVMASVTREISGHLGAVAPLFISIAAGIREVDLNRWLGGDRAVVRCMPNTPALVQSGATALYANQATSTTQRELAESILRAVGLVVWVEEETQLDAVTALSGSGPAYFFLVMEAMEAAAQTLGLPAHSARLLALQTAFGAAKMALESDESPGVLRERVTSPGGTTERALGVLRDGGLERLFLEALTAARDRAGELGVALGDQE